MLSCLPLHMLIFFVNCYRKRDGLATIFECLLCVFYSMLVHFTFFISGEWRRWGIYMIYIQKCAKWSWILIPHMQQNINFEFLFKHLRVQLDQYKVSTDPSVLYIHNNLVRMTDCNFDQKNKWTNSYHCVYLMMTMNYWPIAQKEIGVLFCMFLYSVSFEFWGGFGFFFHFY